MPGLVDSSRLCHISSLKPLRWVFVFFLVGGPTLVLNNKPYVNTATCACLAYMMHANYCVTCQQVLHNAYLSNLSAYYVNF